MEVDKIFIEQPAPEPEVRAFIPIYKPLKTETCEKCKEVIAERVCLYHDESYGSLAMITQLGFHFEQSQVILSTKMDNWHQHFRQNSSKSISSSTLDSYFEHANAF
jgi:hypothetical protein